MLQSNFRRSGETHGDEARGLRTAARKAEAVNGRGDKLTVLWGVETTTLRWIITGKVTKADWNAQQRIAAAWYGITFRLDKRKGIYYSVMPVARTEPTPTEGTAEESGKG